MTQKSELGKRGEDFACEYLISKGYKVIDRNYRKPWGEIDIIARALDKTLVFVEVKTMKESFGGLAPEDQVSKSKLIKTQRAASLYAGHYPEKVDDEKGWRIDLLAICINDYSANNEDCAVKHYENIG